MIYVDRRVGSKEVLPILLRLQQKAELGDLPFGDFAFDGNGPHGSMCIGVERKTLHDMLHCIDDGRFAGFQLPGMRQLYNKSYLILEGAWRNDEQGYLMEGFKGGSWGYCKYRSSSVRYEKLFRYLLSVQLGGVTVIHSRDIEQTAFNLIEIYCYFQKAWKDHRSLQTLQEISLPTIGDKPSVTREWAARLEGIGQVHSLAAEKLFRTPIALAKSSEIDWMRIPGIGIKTAKSVIRQIWGLKR